MPQKVGSKEDLISQIKTKYRKVDTLNSAKLIELRENKLCKTSTRHRKNPKQSGVVVVDSCFDIIVAYQDGVTNREYLLKNKPLALI